MLADNSAPSNPAEFKEMSYQYYNDYFFDSSKFAARFGNMVTPVDEQLKTVVASVRAGTGK